MLLFIPHDFTDKELQLIAYLLGKETEPSPGEVLDFGTFCVQAMLELAEEEDTRRWIRHMREEWQV